jgi:hypothetical protein
MTMTKLQTRYGGLPPVPIHVCKLSHVLRFRSSGWAVEAFPRLRRVHHKLFGVRWFNPILDCRARSVFDSEVRC